MASNHTDVLTHFWYFLTAYVHTVLYLRSVYSQDLFTRARLHNAEGYQSRSPELCQYINDVTMSIHAKLLEGNVGRIGIVVYTREDKDESIQVKERYVLDVSTFSTRILNISERGCGKGEKDSFPISSPIPAQVDLPSTPHYQRHTLLDENALPDLSEQLRAALIRLVVQVERESLQPLEDPS